MTPFPRERTLDNSLALLREGYPFIARRSRRFGSDIFRTRLTLQPAICLLLHSHASAADPLNAPGGWRVPFLAKPFDLDRLLPFVGDHLPPR